MSVRFIAIDIDGTLLDSRGVLPDINRQAIHDAIGRDIEVGLVTGRSFHHTRHIAAELPSSVVLILNNGAIVKKPDGETRVRYLLPKQVAAHILESTRTVRSGVALMFDRFDQRQFVCEGMDWTHPHRRGYYARHRSVILEVGSLLDELSEDPIQVSFNGGVAAMRVLAARLTALPRANEFSHTLTEYASRDFSLLDVLVAGCSKGATLAEWIEQRGLARADVMAVGDNLNDREMLEFAGVPVVMGNGVPELRSRGWPETGSNDAGGLAAAIALYTNARA